VTISFASNIFVHWLWSSVFKLFIWSDDCSLLSLTILFSQKKAWLYFLIGNQSIVCLMSRSNIGRLHFDWSSRISNITTYVYITASMSTIYSTRAHCEQWIVSSWKLWGYIIGNQKKKKQNKIFNIVSLLFLFQLKFSDWDNY
jgi:hypothetical protein